MWANCAARVPTTKEGVMATKKSVSLSVGRGEKLPASKGAGLTEKGRAKYNAATGSNLKAPAPSPKTKADQGRKDSFCARMEGVVKNAKGPAERAKASLKRWKC
jgi:hypothetical protein